MIFANTLIGALAKLNGDPTISQGLIGQIFAFLGNPVIAVGLGVVVAIYSLVPRRPREEVIADMEKGVESAGIILLVTGAGGALGAVLRDSGAGQYMGEWVATLPLPAVLIPFVIATLVRLIQGSGTVAMITGASISAPILAVIPDVNMIFAAQAAAIGSMVFGYFNDSYFWVVNRMLGVKNAKHQIITWSVPTMLFWFTSLLTLLLFNSILG
ncbi:GntP family permease [Azotobacter armeniacus]